MQFLLPTGEGGRRPDEGRPARTNRDCAESRAPRLVILSWRSGEAAKRSEGPPPYLHWGFLRRRTKPRSGDSLLAQRVSAGKNETILRQPRSGDIRVGHT